MLGGTFAKWEALFRKAGERVLPVWLSPWAAGATSKDHSVGGCNQALATHCTLQEQDLTFPNV